MKLGLMLMTGIITMGSSLGAAQYPVEIIGDYYAGNDKNACLYDNDWLISKASLNVGEDSCSPSKVKKIKQNEYSILENCDGNKKTTKYKIVKKGIERDGMLLQRCPEGK